MIYWPPGVSINRFFIQQILENSSFILLGGDFFLNFILYVANFV